MSSSDIGFWGGHWDKWLVSGTLVFRAGHCSHLKVDLPIGVVAVPKHWWAPQLLWDVQTTSILSPARGCPVSWGCGPLEEDVCD